MNDMSELNGAGLPDGASFDLDTAWLRRAQGDLQGFAGRFALLAESALPGQTTVKRVKEGVFRRVERVAGVSIALGTEVFVMRLPSPSVLETVVERRVGGVAISSRAVDPHAWMAGLMAAIKSQTAHARALSELLGSL